VCVLLGMRLVLDTVVCVRREMRSVRGELSTSLMGMCLCCVRGGVVSCGGGGAPAAAAAGATGGGGGGVMSTDGRLGLCVKIVFFDGGSIISRCLA
jgi:hypothetical protein